MVEDWIPGALLSAINHSEVVARALEKQMPLETIQFELGRLPVTLVPFDEPQSNLTATLKAPTRPLGLSLADRACLALAMDRGLPLITGDRDLVRAPLRVQIIPFR